MSDEAALLAAIAAHPDEDTPRLVYADWLDEHDQPVRAEFIRLQIALETGGQDDLPRAIRAIQNNYVELGRRQQELLDHHRPELLGPFATLPASTRIEFRRGFVSLVEVSVDDFLAHAETLATASPRPGVAVDGVAARHADFIYSPHLDCVTRVRAYAPPRGDTQRRIARIDGALIGPGGFPRLETLDLEACGLDDTHLNLFATVSQFPATRSRKVPFPALVDLDLSNNLFTDAGVASLLNSPLLRQLKRLILGGNPIGDTGAIALAERWPTGDADRLETLNLRFTNIGQPGQQALLARFGGRVDLF